MLKLKISTDSISDLSEELLEKNDISYFPLMINMGEESAYDSPQMPKLIYEFVEKTGKTPKTAARGPEEYLEFFKQNKPDGGEIVHFCISKFLSASYQNACAAAKELEGVYVVDTTSLSTGAGLSVLYACDLKNQGLSGKEIFEKCRDRAVNAQASFVLDSVEFLHKGGRCSSAAFFVSTILKIRPMIKLKDGKMSVGKKYMMRFDRAVDKYFDDIMNNYNCPDLTRAFITFTTIPDATLERVKERVLKRYPFKELHCTIAGGTVTSHCGQNTIGLLYFNDGERIDN